MSLSWAQITWVLGMFGHWCSVDPWTVSVVFPHSLTTPLVTPLTARSSQPNDSFYMPHPRSKVVTECLSFQSLQKFSEIKANKIYIAKFHLINISQLI